MTTPTDQPVKGHDGGLHHVPGWPDDVPGVRGATPGEDGEEGMAGTVLVQRPVSKVHYHFQVRHVDLQCSGGMTY